jgi:hypothetical protein
MIDGLASVSHARTCVSIGSGGRGGLTELAGCAAAACGEAGRTLDKLWSAHADNTAMTTNKTAPLAAATNSRPPPLRAERADLRWRLDVAITAS